MTTFLKFLLGEEKILKQTERKVVSDHSPIRGRNDKSKRKFVYNTSHSFSVRTNRDRFQTPGELYLGDNDFKEEYPLIRKMRK